MKKAGVKNGAGGDRHSAIVAPTKKDAKMALRHHRDSIRYNKAHADEHMKAMKEHRREMSSLQKKLKNGEITF